jgi:hypothetical protein
MMEHEPSAKRSSSSDAGGHPKPESLGDTLRRLPHHERPPRQWLYTRAVGPQ